jgi:hypothetical protein
MRARHPRGWVVLAGIVAAGAVVLAQGPATVGADKDKDKSGKAAKRAGSRRDYVDAMLQEAWDAAGVKPSAIAPDAEYMRRAYLDIVGRIPTVSEAVAFLEAKDAGKRAKLVEYLLAGPDYPKNFGNTWAILMLGRKRPEHQADRAALANWMRRQFAENRPWNEVVYDLVTAKGSNKENGAVNFTLAHLGNLNRPGEKAVNLTSFTTRLFLGQQIQCTQCHDHPSNDWKQKDFWGINAFFLGVNIEQVRKAGPNGAEVYDHTEMTDEPTSAYVAYEKRNAYMEIAYPTYLDGRKISQGPDVNRREELGKFLTDPAGDQLARAFVNRMWGHFMGRGFVQPVDDFGAHNPASHPELLDKLAKDFKASGFDVKELIRWITASKAYHVTSVTTKANEKDETLFSHMALKPMTPEQLFDSLLVATQAHQAAGADVDKTRDAWLKQFVVTFANDEEGEASNFQGTIPQALMMMNGELMTKATGGRAGSFLAKLLEQANTKTSGAPEVFVINRLYLSALARHPSRTEMARARELMASTPDTIYAVEDLFWALLNSNEFVLNH